jgi:hypothetical protein
MTPRRKGVGWCGIWVPLFYDIFYKICTATRSRRSVDSRGSEDKNFDLKIWVRDGSADFYYGSACFYLF